MSTIQKRYFTFNQYLKRRFGEKVWKIPVHGNFTCPNRNGTKGWGGCIYCRNDVFSPQLDLRTLSIAEQIRQGIVRIQRKQKVAKFLVYFQSYSNTYAPLSQLEHDYDQVMQFEEVVGLAIGTRPDCISPKKLDLIESYAGQVEVWLEYGLQSCHNRTLDWIHRGHTYEDFLKAIEMTRQRHINICVHVIIGLPGETKADMLATAEVLADLPIQAVKIHPLQVYSGTALEKLYQEGKVQLLNFEDYVSIACDFLERLPENVVIQRLTADAPAEVLIAPAWCLNKMKLLNAIDSELERRDSFQGKRIGAGLMDE